MSTNSSAEILGDILAHLHDYIVLINKADTHMHYVNKPLHYLLGACHSTKSELLSEWFSQENMEVWGRIREAIDTANAAHLSQERLARHKSFAMVDVFVDRMDSETTLVVFSDRTALSDMHNEIRTTRAIVTKYEQTFQDLHQVIDKALRGRGIVDFVGMRDKIDETLNRQAITDELKQELFENVRGRKVSSINSKAVERIIENRFNDDMVIADYLVDQFSVGRGRGASSVLTAPSEDREHYFVLTDKRVLKLLSRLELDPIDWNTLKLVEYTLQGIYGFDHIRNILPENAWKLHNFILDLFSNYRDNHFHNHKHAFMVFQSSCLILKGLLQSGVKLSGVESLGLLLAALGHDVDHRGMTNTFEVNNGSDLALIYNDKSVLENHHSSCTFQILRKPENNFLQSFKVEDIAQIRAIIVECILGTDMAQHFQMVEKFKGFDPSNPENMNLKQMLVYVLHCADLSNATRPFSILKRWAELLDQEFTSQVKLERKLGLPVSSFLVAETPVQFAKREMNFLDFVVYPMWECLAMKFSFVDEWLPEIRENLDIWNQMYEDLQGQDTD